MNFRDMTIRQKLTLLSISSSVIAVILASILFFFMMVRHFEASYEKSLSGLAEVLAHNCQASVAFRLPEEANNILSSLSSRPSVTYANITDLNGSVFASYGRMPASGIEGKKSSGMMIVGEEIKMGGRVIGALYLYDDLRSIKRMKIFAFWAALLAVSFSLVAAIGLSAPMQRFISGPILDLASSTIRIAKQKDFSMRAEKHGNDEVGELVDAFNTMLDQIEKRNAELMTSEYRFRTLVDQAVDSFFLLDHGGIIIDINSTACNNLGYTRAELLSGMNMKDIDSSSAIWDTDMQHLNILEESGAITYESLLHRKDSSAFPVEMRLGLLRIGNATYVMGLARDTSERMEAEKEKKQLGLQLQQAQKMEAIGLLAGGIAHDFNNMLTAIIGYASLLDAQTEPGSPSKDMIGPILTSAEKSADLTRQLLAFSRKQVISPKAVDLNELIRGMEKLLHRLLGEDIDFRTQLTGRDMTVMVDPGQIEQVLMNLCTNARDAMKGGGLLSINTEQAMLEDSYVGKHDMAREGRYAAMSVTDTGGGMDEETRTRIFEPFFTTKEMGKGTGLGLAIVYGIVKQHNGHINVYSEPGKGTTFRVYLPLTAPQGRKEAETELIIPKGGTETILLAEDNEDVRRLLKNVLEGSGYNVIEAADGAEASEKFELEQEKIELAVLDVIMPRKSGKEVSDLIKAIRPEMKILFTSGYTADMISNKGLLEENIDFISKPVTPQKLLTKVREILDRT